LFILTNPAETEEVEVEEEEIITTEGVEEVEIIAMVEVVEIMVVETKIGTLSLKEMCMMAIAINEFI
jgi:hypothetical protein